MTDRQILKVIGGNIRRVRHQANLTQECVAELVGIHSKTFGRIERGDFSFAAITFVRLVQCLKVGPTDLLVGVPAPDKQGMERITKALTRRRKAAKRHLASPTDSL